MIGGQKENEPSVNPERSSGRGYHSVKELLAGKFKDKSVKVPETLTSAGLQIDTSAFLTLPPAEQRSFSDQLAELNALGATEEELIAAYMATKGRSTSSEVSRQPNKYPLFKRVLSLVSGLMMAGLITDNVHATSQLPDPTPVFTPSPEITKSPTPKPTIESLIPTATPKAEILVPTATPTPEATTTSTPTPEITATPEIMTDWAVFSTTANLRLEPSVASEKQATAQAGDTRRLTDAKPVTDSEGRTWRQVYWLEDNTNPDNNVLLWVWDGLFTVQKMPLPSPGTGGDIETQPSSENAPAESSENEMSTGEISKAEEDMRRWLPEDFEEFYQAKGGSVSWNEKHLKFQVTMPVGTETRTYLLYPQTSAEKVSADLDPTNNNGDSEHGLYYLDEKGTVSHSFVNSKGELITQTFRFLVSPEFPIPMDEDLWSGTFIPSDAKVVFGDDFINNSEQTVKILREMFAYPEDKSFELDILFSGQNMSEFNPNGGLRTSRDNNGLYRGGNDFKSIVLDLDNDSDRKAAVYYADPISHAIPYLVETDDLKNGKEYVGADYLIAALERLAPDVQDRDVAQQFSDNATTVAIEDLYALEKTYGELSINIVFPENTLNQFINYLNNQ